MKIVRIEQMVWDSRLPDFGTRQFRVTYKLQGNMHHYVSVMAVDEMQAYKLAMPEMLDAELKSVVREYLKYSKDKQPSSMLSASKNLVKLQNKMEAVKEQIKLWAKET